LNENVTRCEFSSQLETIESREMKLRGLYMCE
jgi:hypothetical protein